MKVGIIALAKNENLYIKEWAEHHFNIGFDHIIICDNNDVDDEKISDVLHDERVTIVDYRGIRDRFQSDFYKDVYTKYRKCFDWLMFLDVDEFVEIQGFRDVHDYLSQDMFKNKDVIRLTWKVYTDSGLLDVVDGDYSVKRFTDFITDRIRGRYFSLRYTKCFLRCTIYSPTIKIINHNIINVERRECNSVGEHCHGLQEIEEPIYERAWVNHYMTKTIGEYITQKFFRGGVNKNAGRYRLMYFFDINEITNEKVEYALKLLREEYGKRGQELPASIEKEASIILKHLKFGDSHRILNNRKIRGLD